MATPFSRGPDVTLYAATGGAGLCDALRPVRADEEEAEEEAEAALAGEGEGDGGSSVAEEAEACS